MVFEQLPDDFVSLDTFPSPESLLEDLEDQLEFGDLTIEEAMLILKDYARSPL